MEFCAAKEDGLGWEWRWREHGLGLQGGLETFRECLTCKKRYKRKRERDLCCEEQEKEKKKKKKKKKKMMMMMMMMMMNNMRKKKKNKSRGVLQQNICCGMNRVCSDGQG